MLKKKKTDPNQQVSLSALAYRDGEIRFNFILNKKKILVGSAPHCDIYIDDPSVSHYHAMIIMQDDTTGRVIDLASNNGIAINDEPLNTSNENPTPSRDFFFASGDRLHFGTVELHLQETFIESFDDQDEGKVQKIDILGPAIKKELRPVQGLSIIDGEYCDITFDESTHTLLKDDPFGHIKNSPVSFIEAFDQSENFPIVRPSSGSSIEIAQIASGHIISIDYFPVKDGKITAVKSRPKKDEIVLVSLDESVDNPQHAFTFIKIKSGQVTISPLQGHQHIKGRDSDKNEANEIDHTSSIDLAINEQIVIEKATIQIFIRLTDAPPKVSPAPFFGRDKHFYQQTGKILAGIMSLALLLLLVDISIEEPKEEQAVIYKRAVKSEEAKNVAANSNTDQNSGNKQKELPKEKTQDSKKGQTSSKKTPTPASKADLAAPKAQAQAKQEVPKQKAYKLAYSGDFNNFLNQKSTVVAEVNETSNEVSIKKGENSAVQGIKGLSTSKTSMEIGHLGSDNFGNKTGSFGTKGLTSKNGTDSTYVEPKTVVLGSMDPELLRKILQEYLPQFRHCYQQELLAHSDGVQGVVDLNFRIGTTGKVVKTDVRAKDSRFSKTGLDCMGQVLRLIDFPKPKGGGVVDVRQPLNFFSEKNKI